jgi:flagellar FliL protein
MKSSASKKSGNSRLFAICISFLLVVAGSAAAWISKNAVAESSTGNQHGEKLKPPAYILLEPFTVNLRQDGNDQFLRASFTVQVDDTQQIDLFKENLAQARNRCLMILISKRTSDISRAEGKIELLNETKEALNQEFKSLGIPVKVIGVYLNSWVIQY